MIKVTFDGVEYTKATHVAKEFGYTADYLGQLCRAKKVNARLVGRSWFINVPSLEAHREKKYSNLRKNDSNKERTKQGEAAEQNADTTSKNYLRRVPPPDAPTRKFIQRLDEDGTRRHLSMHYEEDDHSLIPKVADKPKVTLLKVGIAGAESVPVKTTEKAVNKMAPEPLPDVALSGKIKVAAVVEEGATESEAEQDGTPEPKKKSKQPHKKPSSKRDNNKNKLQIKEVETLESEKHIQQKDTSHPVAASQPASEGARPKRDEDSLTINPLFHTAHSTRAINQEVPIEGQPEPDQPVAIHYQLVAAAVVFAVVIGAFVLSAEQVVVVTDQVVNFAIDFSWSNVANMALVLFTG